MGGCVVIARLSAKTNMKCAVAFGFFDECVSFGLERLFLVSVASSSYFFFTLSQTIIKFFLSK